MFPTLEHLVIDEDMAWSRNSPGVIVPIPFISDNANIDFSISVNC